MHDASCEGVMGLEPALRLTASAAVAERLAVELGYVHRGASREECG